MSSRQRILILRPDRIGDSVLFSGALRNLRAHWPDAHITLVTQPAVRPLYARCPYIDRQLAVDRLEPWEIWRRRLPTGSWALERLMLRDGVRKWWYPECDIVLYPVSAPIEIYLRAVRLMHATEKWGFGGDQIRLQELYDPVNAPERVFTRCYRNRPEDRWMHEVDRTRLFLEAMEVPVDGLNPELWLTASDRTFAIRAVPDCGSIGFFIGAGSELRRWPPARWIALGSRLRARSRDVLLLGGAAERQAANVIRDGLLAAGVVVRDLVGGTGVCELAACIARCRAVVSNDSSGLHLAVAQDVPAVGIMGGYHFGRFYPWGNPAIHRVAQVAMDCYHCNDACIYGDWRCVSTVSVDTVEQELDAALA